MNHIATAFALAFLGYLGYVAIAPSSAETLNRMCDPVFSWPKKALVSGARIASPSSVPTITEKFDAGFGYCRAWGWGVLYRDEHIRLTTDLQKVGEDATKGKTAE